MSKYDNVPRRSVTRTPYTCDFCRAPVAKGERRCSLGMFESCKDCEHLLPERFSSWKSESVKTNALIKRKLTNERAIQVRVMVAEGRTYASVAARFGVSVSTIGEIVRGESYKDAI